MPNRCGDPQDFLPLISQIIVDYGGTKTRIWGADIQGKPLQSVTLISKPIRHLPAVLKKSFSHLKIKTLPLLIIGAKSIWTAKEKKWLYARTRFLADNVVVMSDIELAFRKHFGESPGILILAGTGSISLGRNPKGKIARAGGLGPKIGDEGSGYWIGKKYCERVLKSSKMRSVQDFAAYAPQVIRKAQAGDDVCRGILIEAHEHLGRLVTSVRRQLKSKDLALKYAGGLFDNPYFKRGFLGFLRSANAAL